VINIIGRSLTKIPDTNGYQGLFIGSHVRDGAG
jgi:hypothetical protein